MIRKLSRKIRQLFKINTNNGNNDNNREIWLAEKLKSLQENQTILDAGAGQLRFKKYCSHLKYISQDFCQYSGGGKEGVNPDNWDTSGIDIVSDIINIPLDDGSVDNILCTEVLEHLVRPELAIKEFSRLIKRRGTLIITAPFASLTHFAPYHYCTGFNQFWWKEILNSYDFEIVEMTPNGNYFDFLAQENSRIEEVCNMYNISLNVFDKRKIQKAIKILNSLSINGNASSDLLNFGYMIVAKKR